MSKFNVGPWTFRVWREQVSLHYDNDDLWKVTHRQQMEGVKDVALRLLQLDRVNAVEFTDREGNGEVLYKDWP
jgi:hypothetical protein